MKKLATICIAIFALTGLAKAQPTPTSASKIIDRGATPSKSAQVPSPTAGPSNVATNLECAGLAALWPTFGRSSKA